MSAPAPEARPADLPAPPLRRSQALDGIRGLSAIAIFGFHAFWSAFHSAWVAVDVFFVLSGYLITSLLIKEHERNGRIDFPKFLKSRTIRLFPPLLVVVLLSAVLYAVWPSAVPQRSFLHSAISSLTYTQNLFVGRHPALADPLVHTWTLSEEQQFYVLWPFVLGVLLLVGRWFAAAIALALAVGSALLLLATSHGPDPAAFYWPWTRLTGLALGAAVALALSSSTVRERARRPLTTVAVLAVLGLVAALLWLPSLAKGGAVVAAGVCAASVITAAVIAHVVTEPLGPMARALSIAPFVHLGRWSYGIYLAHVPFLVVFQSHVDHHETALWLALVASLVTGAVLHHALELPLERYRHRHLAVVLVA